MSILAFYRTRILQALGDPSGARYDSSTLDEALRQALADYTAAFPQVSLANITVSTPGSIQPLASLAGDFVVLLQVCWPFIPSASDHPIYDAWYSFMLDGVPAVFFNGEDVPVENDLIQVVYGRSHTIQNLDTAGVTSVRPEHEAPLCLGAAAYALRSRAGGSIKSYGSLEPCKELAVEANTRLGEFRRWLSSLHFSFPTTGRWALDAWDMGE